MYNPPHFEVPDVGWMHDFIRGNAFATLAAVIGGEIHVAYAPVLLDQRPLPLGTVHFHFARSNPLAGLPNGSVVKLSLMGPHTYVSPDWYESQDQVPTWNYMAVEGTGRVQRLADAHTQAYLARLTAEQESYLAPKPQWSPARVNPDRMKQLLLGIVAFELAFDTLEGKAKLSQNRSPADIAGVIAALRRRGDETGTAVASAMQDLSLR